MDALVPFLLQHIAFLRLILNIPGMWTPVAADK